MIFTTEGTENTEFFSVFSVPLRLFLALVHKRIDKEGRDRVILVYA